MTSKPTVVILAGGRGARFDHESQVKPKPLIEVAGQPIIQHIIDSFVDQGFDDFIVAGGYLIEQINGYFASIGRGPFAYSIDPSLPWWQYGVEYPDLCGIKVVVADTGLESHTGQRLARLRPLLQSTFVLTYGDGLSDVRIEDVLTEHRRDYGALFWTSYGNGTWPDHPAHCPPLATLTAVQPPGRFGSLQFNGSYNRHVREFYEKGRNDWINGGFMVMEPEFIDRYLLHDDRIWKLEDEALPTCASEWLLRAHRHAGYWACMDTRRDLERIEEDVMADGRLPWRRVMMHPDDKEKTTDGNE